MHVVSKVSKDFPDIRGKSLGHLGNYVHSLVVYKLRTPSILVMYAHSMNVSIVVPSILHINNVCRT